MRFPAEVILVIALGFAAVIFWRLHERRALPLASGNPPPGANVLPLGQFAVAPDKQWLLIQPGQ